jgi:predicted ATPase/class 3 adenylate cyclase
LLVQLLGGFGVKCPRCQAENPPGTRFCGQCAAPLAAVCPSCGASNPPANKFCGQCAAPLDKPAQPRFTAPESYTPKHLAEKILTSKAALEGERKQVTVLFADLKGSMELLADRDPEEARKILDPVLTRMMDAVHHYEGTVNQVMGDGIMALFGAPLAHEDHAVRACYAALRMQEAVRRYSDELRRAQGVEVQIRVGVNSGEVVVRSIGSDLHMDYTAVGQTTHLAARMEQLADPGAIVITTDTLALAEGYVEVKFLGPVLVKGLGALVEVYAVIGAGPVRTRLQAAARRGLTRFVGRDAEVQQLRRTQELAVAGHGQTAAIVGEAGVGKSRFVYEFTHSDLLRDWLVLETSSVSYGKATSYLPVIDLLRGYFKIQNGDDFRRIREKMTNKLLTLDSSLNLMLPPLLALLDVPLDDVSWQRLDPVERRRRTLDAVKWLLLREARQQPLLVVFEDLHWIDGESQALLDGLVESLGSARLLLLVSYRLEYQHAWGRKTFYSQLRLDALSTEGALELLDALLGNDRGLAPLKELLVKGGNPFFLEETIRTLVETGALAGEHGAYRLTRPVETLQVPPTVQTILAARIDRLSPEEKRLLQAASVIGNDVPYALLAAIAEESEEVLRRGLAHLQEAEFLYETSLFPELDYTFKHALTHDVAYGSLLQERRRALHARIVAASEWLYADRLTEQPERLAQHALRGEVWEKAVAYSRQAGTKAFARSALREGVMCFAQALAALTHLPESRATQEQAIDLRFDQRNALLELGEMRQMLDYLREAETLAKVLDDQPRLGRISSYMCRYFRAVGAHDAAVASGEHALAAAETLGDFALQVMARHHLGVAHHVLGDHRRAIELLRGNVDSLAGDLVREFFGLATLPAVISRAWLVRCLAELGTFPEGIAHGEEAIRIAEAVDHPNSLLHAYHGVGFLSLRVRDLSRAIPVLERCVDLCRVFNFWLWFSETAAALGCAYAFAGRITEALPLLEEAEQRDAALGTTGGHGGHALRLGYFGEAYLLAGRTQKAVQLARWALDLSRAHKERGHQAWALRLLGEIVAHQDSPEIELAANHYRQARTLAVNGHPISPKSGHRKFPAPVRWWWPRLA